MTGAPGRRGEREGPGFEPETLLKADLFGRVERGHSSDRDRRHALVRRDTRAAPWWSRWLARRLASREAKALRHLEDLASTPPLVSWRRGVLLRGWLAKLDLLSNQPDAV